MDEDGCYENDTVNHLANQLHDLAIRVDDFGIPDMDYN